MRCATSRDEKTAASTLGASRSERVSTQTTSSTPMWHERGCRTLESVGNTFFSAGEAQTSWDALSRVAARFHDSSRSIGSSWHVRRTKKAPDQSVGAFETRVREGGLEPPRPFGH